MCAPASALADVQYCTESLTRQVRLTVVMMGSAKIAHPITDVHSTMRSQALSHRVQDALNATIFLGQPNHVDKSLSAVSADDLSQGACNNGVNLSTYSVRCRLLRRPSQQPPRCNWRQTSCCHLRLRPLTCTSINPKVFAASRNHQAGLLTGRAPSTW